MNSTKLLGWLGVGVVSALLMSAPAFAWDFGSRRADLRHDRGELRNDRHELNHDRRELRGLFRRGAPASEIARERGEIRQDWRELGQDRGELWRDRGWDRDWDRDNGYRYEPYRRGWYDRDAWWSPYWR